MVEYCHIPQIEKEKGNFPFVNILALFTLNSFHYS